MSILEQEVEHAEKHECHTSTSNWVTNPLPSSYGSLYDGERWYRTSRKFGDIGSETNGRPYSTGTEDKEFIDNLSVRKGYVLS